MSEKKQYRIVGLEAENFKRLSAVNLKLDGAHLILGGDNESGKTSVLDAIWVALGGPKVAEDLKVRKPIREGAESAKITLDLGDLIVTRNWTSNDKTYLKVSTKDGAAYPSPQAMLDALMGKLFDPSEFARLKDRDQKEMLLSLLGIEQELADIDQARQVAYAKRTEINREVTRLENTLKSMPEVPEDTPDEEVDGVEVLNEQEEAGKVLRENERTRQVAREVEQNLEDARRQVASVEKEIAGLQETLAKKKDLVKGLQSANVKGQQALVGLVDPDMTVFQAKARQVDETNLAVRRKKDRARTERELATVKDQSETLTGAIQACDEDKNKLVKAAKFPVEGLGFDEDGVTYKGIPFGQCSSEEQIRVGMAIAMAMSPRLKVIRISEGSLLDGKNFKVITDLAAENGYQLLVERVGDPGNMGIVIEDGKVKE